MKETIKTIGISIIGGVVMVIYITSPFPKPNKAEEIKEVKTTVVEEVEIKEKTPEEYGKEFEERMMKEQMEEEKIKEEKRKQLEERVREEMASNPNFMATYNEIIEIHENWKRFDSHRRPNYMKEKHEQLDILQEQDHVKQLKEIETEVNTILGDLKSLVVMDVMNNNRYFEISEIKHVVENFNK